MPEIEQIRPFGPDSQLYDIRDNSKLPLGYGTELPLNADLDDYTTPGKYYSASSTTTATIAHKPDDVSIGFSLYVFGEDSDGLIQIVVETVVNNFYGKIRYRMRTSASSNFQEWRKIYTSTETIPVGSHTHDAADVTSGALPIERGGTGAMTAADALAALGAAAANHDHNSILSPFTSSNRATTADQNPGDGRLMFFHATSSMTTNRPPDGDGYILHFAWDKLSPSWASQLYVQAAGHNVHMMIRGRDSSSWGTWRRIYTEDDIIPIANGGTGATTAAAARNALGLGNTSGALPIANGGTGATTVPLAVENLKILGLGAAATSIPSNADYNSYAEPGIYSVANNGIAASLAHRPSAHAGKLVVWHAMAGSGAPGQTWYYVLQAYTDYEGTTWIRSGQSGSSTTITWDSWYRIYDTKTPPTASEVGAAAASHSHSEYYSSNISRTKNTVLAAPNGSNGGAAFRALVAADLPTVTIAKGGTGKTTAAEGLAALGGISKKLLWTNSSPTSAMAGQTISISNMSTYQEFEVYFMLHTGTQYAESRHFIYNVQGRVTMNNGSSVYTRDIKPVSTGLTITTGTSSSYVIPYKIYGIKGVT